MLLELLMPIAAKLWLYEKIQIESHEQFGNLCACTYKMCAVFDLPYLISR